MCNFLSVIGRLMRKNWVFTILFLLETLLALFMIIGAYNRYRELDDRLAFVQERPALSRAVIAYSPSSDLNRGQDNVVPLLQNAQGFRGIAENYSDNLPPEVADAMISIYDSFTAKLFFPPVSNGRLPVPEVKKGVLEVLMVRNRSDGKNNFKIGDVLTVHQPYAEQLRIVGEAKVNEALLLADGRRMVTGSGFDVSILFKNRFLYPTYFLACSQSIKGNSQAFHLYYFDPSITLSALKKVVEASDIQFPTYSIPQLIENSHKIIADRIQTDMPLIATVSLLLFFGFLSITFLNTRRIYGDFKVYRLCGASRRLCAMAYFFMTFFIMLFAILILFIGMQILYHLDTAGRQYRYLLDGSTLLLLVTGSFLMSVVCSLPIYYRLRGENYDPIRKRQ